jgi:hypothetical protein
MVPSIRIAPVTLETSTSQPVVCHPNPDSLGHSMTLGEEGQGTYPFSPRRRISWRRTSPKLLPHNTMTLQGGMYPLCWFSCLFTQLLASNSFLRRSTGRAGNASHSPREVSHPTSSAHSHGADDVPTTQIRKYRSTGRGGAGNMFRDVSRKSEEPHNKPIINDRGLNEVCNYWCLARTHVSEIESQMGSTSRGRARRMRSQSNDAFRPSNSNKSFPVHPDQRRHWYELDLIATLRSLQDTGVVRETTTIDDCVSLKTCCLVFVWPWRRRQHRPIAAPVIRAQANTEPEARNIGEHPSHGIYKKGYPQAQEWYR